MNQLSLTTAKLALQHYGIISANIDSLKNERERMFAELGKICRLNAFPSQANFITIRVPDADLLFDTLKQTASSSKTARRTSAFGTLPAHYHRQLRTKRCRPRRYPPALPINQTESL
ncbi:histidinol-phosphate aminotransferase [Neisseria gonorrhoeae]|uniref:Histidinol-phosphate aminotransferase n=1 Tax=Neisseria gonorrhoeae TaxID=485 RepID=A0A378VVF6_NEIGO|nr:histidinol-phosphate aminotransferase [Neisseria gonorrhoeae]